MDSRTNQWFLMLAETLHFGRTAERCHMSPSTLTRALKALEHDVGAPLFERDNRTVALTPAGALYRHYARESVRIQSELEQALMADREQLSGTLSLFSSVTASYSFLYELLARLREQHPGIRFALQTGDPDEAVERVQAGDVQVSIGARPTLLPTGIQFQGLATTPLVLIEALSNRNAADVANWSERPVILPKHGVARDGAKRWFAKQGVTPDVFAEVSGNEAIVSMVSLGGGIGVVPEIVLKNSPLAAQVRTLEVDIEFDPLEIGLFALRKNLTNRLVDALWSVKR